MQAKTATGKAIDAAETAYEMAQSLVDIIMKEEAEWVALLFHAFDTHRAAIHAVAIATYKRGRKGSYELVAADFSPRH
jgi:hypothetical protein